MFKKAVTLDYTRSFYVSILRAWNYFYFPVSAQREKLVYIYYSQSCTRYCLHHVDYYYNSGFEEKLFNSGYLFSITP